MKSTQKALVLIAITMICAAGTAHAGMMGDPHAIGMGSTAWLTGPAGFDGGDDPNRVSFTTNGSSSGIAADILLLETGRNGGAFTSQDIQGSTADDRYRTISDLLGEADNESGGIPDGFRPVDLFDRVSTGTNSTDAPDWFALDRGRLRRRHRRFTGGDQPDDPTNPVPEPATVMLLATGLLVIGTCRAFSARGEITGANPE